jgi:hypothetical protein
VDKRKYYILKIEEETRNLEVHRLWRTLRGPRDIRWNAERAVLTGMELLSTIAPVPNSNPYSKSYAFSRYMVYFTVMEFVRL